MGPPNEPPNWFLLEPRDRPCIEEISGIQGAVPQELKPIAVKLIRAALADQGCLAAHRQDRILR